MWTASTVMRDSPVAHRRVTFTAIVLALLACRASDASVARPVTGDEDAAVRIVLSPARAELAIGGSLTLLATAYDSEGKPVSDDVRWESSDTLVARVSDDGETLALAEGDAMLSARIGGVGATATVSVHQVDESPRDSHGVVVSPDSALLSMGMSRQLVAAQA